MMIWRLFASVLGRRQWQLEIMNRWRVVFIEVPLMKRLPIEPNHARVTRKYHQRPVTTLGMPLALLRSQLISISVPQPRAYRKAQASAVRFANGYRRSVQN